jgi:hypothetical protein
MLQRPPIIDRSWQTGKRRVVAAMLYSASGRKSGGTADAVDSKIDRNCYTILKYHGVSTRGIHTTFIPPLVDAVCGRQMV